MYHFNLATYEQAKSDLMALSLTSRDMREIGQPVLYHCFYGYPYKNTLSKFLRTLIFHPELAGHVRALILPENLAKPFVLENESQFLTRTHIRNCIWASSNAGMAFAAWLVRDLFWDESSEVVEFVGPDHEQLVLKNRAREHGDRKEYHVFMRAFRLWQQLLTIRLVSPSISHMAIMDVHSELAQNSFDFDESPKLPLSFPNLRTVSWSLLESLEDFRQFFRYAPQLLKSITLGTTFGPDWIAPQWELPSSCTNVNTLSLACTAPYQGYILQACNQVQDLELYLADDDMAQWTAGMIEPPELSTLNPWPARVTSQLRRLCWSSTVAYTSAKTLPTEDEGLNMFPPIADFKSLETLEIDRLALNVCLMREQGSDMSNSDWMRNIPSILPRSLQTLRLFTTDPSWSWLIIDLEEVALAKETSHPMLSIVQIDRDPRMMTLMTLIPQNEKSLSEVMFDLGVTKAMKDVGIELRFGFKLFLYRGLNHPMPANFDAFSRGWGLQLPP